jgi:hypothetical protein
MPDGVVDLRFWKNGDAGNASEDQAVLRKKSETEVK